MPSSYDKTDEEEALGGTRVVAMCLVIVSILLVGLTVGGLGLFLLHDFWWFGVGISGGIIGWLIVYIVYRVIYHER